MLSHGGIQKAFFKSCNIGPKVCIFSGDEIMLIDVRTYRCKPGTINDHLALYEKFGRSPQYRCLGSPIAFLRGETGNPNEFVHIWLYKNAGDREAKRSLLWSDSEWLSYTKKSAELGALEHQENKLMVPTSFCPLSMRG